ncbi:hypothetical protein Tco_1519653 [Tanacetum coccineum]
MIATNCDMKAKPRQNYQRPLDHLHESQLYPEVPESVLGLLTAVPAVMKHVRSTPLSMTPEHRYDDPGSKCESCIPEAHSGLSNSVPQNVPKPLKKLEPPDPTVVQSHSDTIS